jgi:hypothetical protein
MKVQTADLTPPVIDFTPSAPGNQDRHCHPSTCATTAMAAKTTNATAKIVRNEADLVSPIAGGFDKRGLGAIGFSFDD